MSEIKNLRVVVLSRCMASLHKSVNAMETLLLVGD